VERGQQWKRLRCRMLVFINAHREIRKRMDTNVAFTKEYSKVSISTGNAKWTSNESRTSKERLNEMFYGQRGSLKIFQDELINQGSGLLHLFTLEQQYLSDPRMKCEVVRGRLPKSSTITPILTWWITEALQSCHLWCYHNYPWDWAQSQVNTSLDTTPTLTITTLIQR
jgi:hypothetical protein